MTKIRLEPGDILMHEETPETESFIRSFIKLFQFFSAPLYDHIIHAGLFHKKNNEDVPAEYSKYEELEMDASGLGLDRMKEGEVVHVFRHKDPKLAKEADAVAIHILKTIHVDYSFVDCVKTLFPTHPPSDALIRQIEKQWPKGKSVMCSEFVNLVYAIAIEKLNGHQEDYWRIPLDANPAQMFGALITSQYFDHIAKVSLKKQPSGKMRIEEIQINAVQRTPLPGAAAALTY